MGNERPCRDAGVGAIALGLAMLNRAKRASHIDPPASSYAIMRRARPYRGENPVPGKDVRGELDPTPGIRERPRPDPDMRLLRIAAAQNDYKSIEIREPLLNARNHKLNSTLRFGLGSGRGRSALPHRSQLCCSTANRDWTSILITLALAVSMTPPQSRELPIDWMIETYRPNPELPLMAPGWTF